MGQDSFFAYEYTIIIEQFVVDKIIELYLHFYFKN